MLPSLLSLTHFVEPDFNVTNKMILCYTFRRKKNLNKQQAAGKAGIFIPKCLDCMNIFSVSLNNIFMYK